MRNYIAFFALAIFGMSSALPCMAVNDNDSRQVINVDNQRGGYTFLGNLYPISVENIGYRIILTVPAPKETVIGTAPNCEWYFNSTGQLVIKVENDMVNGRMEVGVKMSNGEIGVYYVIWN